jgi:hypothetical protein
LRRPDRAKLSAKQLQFEDPNVAAGLNPRRYRQPEALAIAANFLLAKGERRPKQRAKPTPQPAKAYPIQDVQISYSRWDCSSRGSLLKTGLS